MSCKVKVISQRTVCHQTNGALALSTQLVTLKIVTTGHRSLLCFIYMVVHGGGGVFHVCGTCVVVVVVVQGGSGGQTCSSHQLPLVTSAPGSRRRAIALIHLRPGAEKHPEAENPATTLMSQVHSNMMGLRTCLYRITAPHSLELLNHPKKSSFQTKDWPCCHF